MECAIKIWDLRKFNIPQNAINDINSLPLNCNFNHFYDQLILSSCNIFNLDDDGSINLHSI